MTAPTVTQTIQDKGLGAVAIASGEVPAIFGCCSSGTVNVPKLYAGGQLKALVADFGYGPGVEAAALHLAKGQAVIFTKLPGTTAGDEGTDGADNATDFTGTGTSVITLTGAARDTFGGSFVVVHGGTIGVAGVTFKYSLDGGRTYSPTIALGTANTYLIPNSGITLAFAAGTLVAGDVAAFVSVEPKWAGADLTAAVDALAATSLKWDFIHLVGKCSATEAGSVKTILASLESAYRYVSAVVSARPQNDAESEATWMAALETDYGSFVGSRIVVGAGLVLIQSPVSQRQYLRPIAWLACVRACERGAHEDLGKVKNGSLDGSLVNSSGAPIAHDERTTPGLDAARFMTATTIVGKRGVYITNPNTMADAGSDFELWQYRRVMDKACSATYGVLVEELSADVRVDSATGFILEKDALAIESAGRTALYEALEKRGMVSPGGTAKPYGLILSRSDNILSTKTITCATQIVPLGYVKAITNTIGFTNPALNVTT